MASRAPANGVSSRSARECVLEQLCEVDRRTLLDYYLRMEQVKKGYAIPSSIDALDWDDPNSLDAWLKPNNFKYGSLAAFRKWALVRFTREELLQMAIIPDRFPMHTSVLLRDLAATAEFNSWIIDQGPLPLWWDRLSSGEWTPEYPIICRPPQMLERRHGAFLWVEDGSSRITVYLRALLKLNLESQLSGYVGFDPDPKSQFLQRKFRREFVGRSGRKYATLKSTLAASRPSCLERLSHALARRQGRLSLR
jgi:hypothetical protein